MDFFKSFAVTKVNIVSSDFTDWRYNIDKFILPSIDGKSEIEQTSIAPIQRPYANAPYPNDVFENSCSGAICFLLRREEKKISASMLRKRIADEETRTQRVAGRETRDGIRDSLYSTAPIKVDFVPVIIDLTGDMYVFTSSKKLITEAKEICSTVFDLEYDEKESETHERNFLTWLWWRMENTDGSLASVNGRDVELILGESVKCKSPIGSIAAKTALEEARASLAKGADVVELETFSIDGENSQKIIFSSVKGLLKGLSISKVPEEMDNFELAFCVVRDLFKVYEELVARHKKEEGLITDDLRQNWGLKKFCPLLIGEF